MLTPGLFVWNDFVTVPEEATAFEVVGQQLLGGRSEGANDSSPSNARKTPRTRSGAVEMRRMTRPS